MALALALDTESTGLNPKTDRLVEIAAVEFETETGSVTGRTFHTLLNPGRKVPAQAAAVHGLTTERLKDEPFFADKADELVRLLQGRDLVIHNARFDTGMLDAEFGRLGLPGVNTVAASVEDTLVLSRRYFHSARHTLDALCKRFNVDTTARVLHGALIDCELLAAVYPHLMLRARKVEAAFEGLLGYSPRALPPQENDALVERIFQMEVVANALLKSVKALEDELKERAGGSSLSGDGWDFTVTESESIDWKGIVTLKLPELDLAPFKKKGSMRTKLELVEEQAPEPQPD